MTKREAIITALAYVETESEDAWQTWRHDHATASGGRYTEAQLDKIEIEVNHITDAINRRRRRLEGGPS